jgi:hypothetical protein
MEQYHSSLHTSTTGLSTSQLCYMRRQFLWYIVMNTDHAIKLDLEMRLVQVNLELQVCRGTRSGEGL